MMVARRWVATSTVAWFASLLLGGTVAHADFQVGQQSDSFSGATNFAFNQAGDPPVHLVFKKYGDNASLPLDRVVLTAELFLTTNITIKPAPPGATITVDYGGARVAMSDPLGMNLGLGSGSTSLQSSIVADSFHQSDPVTPFSKTLFGDMDGDHHFFFTKTFTGSELGQFLASPGDTNFAIPFLAKASSKTTSSTGNGHATVRTDALVGATIQFFSAVPEPTSVVLMAIGGPAALLVLRRRRGHHSTH